MMELMLQIVTMKKYCMQIIRLVSAMLEISHVFIFPTEINWYSKNININEDISCIVNNYVTAFPMKQLKFQSQNSTLLFLVFTK